MGKSDIFEQLPENLRGFIAKSGQFPVLLSKIKRGSQEKEHYWKIVVSEDDNGYGIISVVHGDVGGKESEPATEIISAGKNIGKENQTTPFEQAFKEAKSKFADRFLRNSYLSQEDLKRVGIVEGDLVKIIYPMLANKYKEGSLKGWTIPYGISPKLDGVRCLVRADLDPKTGECLDVHLYSRSMEEMTAYPKIRDEICILLAACPELRRYYLDGEIYSNAVKFEDISGISRKKEIVDLDTEEVQKMNQIQFNIFDLFDPENPDESFKDRYRKLKGCLVGLKGKLDHLSLVPVYLIGNEGVIPEWVKKFTEGPEGGYEGAILRNLSGPYKISTGTGGRSSDLLKVKSSDKEFVKILSIGIKGQTSRVSPVIGVVNDAGISYNVTGSGDEEYRKYILSHKDEFIGKKILIKYDSVTKTGKPRFARTLTGNDGKYILE
jgi:hypothetical protein